VQSLLLTEVVYSSRSHTRQQMLGAAHGVDTGERRAQAGEETVTEMRHFMLAADGQLHDLHSKLRLDHPGGQAMQLHKCIVSGSTGTPKALHYRPC